MHIVKDENGNVCSHGHNHEHAHVHTFEHSHDHSHNHGQEDEHAHQHDAGISHTHHLPEDKQAALLNYMLQHNQSHAGELLQTAEKLAQEDQQAAADELRQAADLFAHGNEHLKKALSLVKDGK